MSDNHKMTGILMGILVYEHGEPFIAFDINGSKVALSVPQAGHFFDQLGDNLHALGFFDDEEEEKNDERVLN